MQVRDGLPEVKAHARNSGSRSLPDSRSAKAMKSAVVTFPYRCAAGQRWSSAKKFWSPMALRTMCRVIAPRSYTVSWKTLSRPGSAMTGFHTSASGLCA